MKCFISSHKPTNVLYSLAFIFTIVFLIYGNTFHAEWHFDDRHSIVDNPKVHLTEFSLPALSRAMQHPDTQRMWRPLAYLSFAVNWYLSQNSVFGYHLVNTLIHFISAFILYQTLLSLFRTPVMRDKVSGDDAYSISLLASVLWAANPIHTQAVTYIVQRMTLLAAVFCIGGVFLYIRARLSPKTQNRVLLFSLCVLCWILALGSKENALLLPLGLLLVEAVFFRDLRIAQTRHRIIIIFAAIGLVIGLAGWILYLGKDPFSILAGYRDRFFTPWERLLTQPRVLLFYLTQIFFPHPARLSIEHDFAVSTSLLEPWTTLPALIIVFGLIVGSLLKISRFPLVCFASLFFFLNHLIESSIVPLEMVFEHRNYLPSMFLFAPVAAGAVWAINRGCELKKSSCWLTCSATVLLLIAFGVGTHYRNRIWLNEVTLWSDAYRKAPLLHRTTHNLAMALYENSGRLEEALTLYYKADSLKMHRRSHRADLYGNIANIHFRLGHFELAEDYYKKAHEHAPLKEYIHYRLIDTLRQQKKWNYALEQVDIAASQAPTERHVFESQRRHSSASQQSYAGFARFPEGHPERSGETSRLCQFRCGSDGIG